MIELRINSGRLEAAGITEDNRAHLVALRDLWEERAAILEYEAGFSRQEAEEKALAELLPRLEKGAA